VTQRDLLRLVLANLNRMRARVALTAIGVTVGTAAVVVLISLGLGLQASAARQFNAFGDLTEITVIDPDSFGAFPGAPDAGRDETLLDDETLDAWRALPNVVAVSPVLDLRGPAELKLGRKTSYSGLQGLDPRAAEAMGWQLAAGSPRLGRGQIVLGPSVFDDGEGPMVFRGGAVAARPVGGGAARPVAAAPTATPSPRSLLGRQIALTLSKTDDEGKEVQRTERLRVAGVFEPSGGQLDRQVYVAMADIDTFNQWLTGERRNKRDGYQNALVKVDDRTHVADVVTAIEAAGFIAFSAQSALNAINQAFLIIQLILGGIGAVALVVAAIGIANTMTMAIYERTKEIGIMKALGATNRDVLRIFLTEAGTIGFLGGLVGILLGWLVGFGIDLFVRTQLQNPANAPPDGGADPIVVTPLWLMGLALAFATVIGIVSGVYPALRAATLKPLQALRTE
jgi:putative ABC transport system permease protein